MTEEIKIKRCYFCGTHVEYFHSNTIHWVDCSKCHANGPVKFNMIDAINAWNNAKFPQEEDKEPTIIERGNG